MVKLKFLFQSICVSGLGWDDKINEEMTLKWFRVLQEFRDMKEVIIPRCYCLNIPNNPIVRSELHGFSDASELCYAACIYFKFIKSNGDIQISLATSKSRLVPRQKKKRPNENKYTVLRLELLGNFLLSKLIVSIMEAVRNDMNIDEIYCSSDSMISLVWIKERYKEFRTFVQNQLIGIRRYVHEQFWSHCRSEQNAADILTKNKKGNLHSWLRGPEFLFSSVCDAEKLERVNYDLEPRGFTDEVQKTKMSLDTTEKQQLYWEYN